jgi:hypothetical protein
MMKQKMKPFGASSSSRLNNNKAAEERGRDPRASNGKENPGPRRDSKTPKTNNLTTIGGAYGFGDESMRKKPTKSKKRRDKAANNKKPDPSPLKKPDPTSVKQPKSKTSVKSIISSALKRSKSDQFKKRDTEVGAKVAAPSPAASLAPANNEYDQLSDMDTACSTPEKESPLITSPITRPDPPTKSISHSKDGRSRQSQMEPVAKNDPDAGALNDRKVMGKKNRRPGKRLICANI